MNSVGIPDGYCDFCKCDREQVWPTAAWTDILLQLLEIYEVADPSDRQAMELAAQLQEDWAIFTFSELASCRLFLSDALPSDHRFLDDGVLIRLQYEPTGPKADHISSWSAFSDEIRLRNRYFPQSVPDPETLTRAINGSLKSISSDTVFFRARRSQNDEIYNSTQMGAPPIAKATGGRANPVGIPYLYLSLDENTAIYETRVANYSQICVASFKVTKDLLVLDLANIVHPDYFSLDDPVASISVFRYLQRLGAELRKPVRASDEPIDYIPTQYLCEMAKATKLDGIQYASSQNPGGVNLVLFDPSSADCTSKVRLVNVTELKARWEDAMQLPLGKDS